MKRNQLIQHWKKWMNRNRSFSKPEMEELESHLWEEMDVMVASEGCSEEEAFHQVITNIGGRKSIHTEFKKTKRFSLSRMNSWAHEHPYQLLIVALLIIAILVGDYIYVIKYSLVKNDIINSGVVLFNNLQNLTERAYISIREPSNKNTSSENNSQWQTVKYHWEGNLIYWFHEIRRASKIHMNIDEISPILLDNGVELLKFNNDYYYVPFDTGSNPLYFCIIDLNLDQFYIVIDNQNTCWISEDNIFTKDTYHVILKPKKYTLHLYEYADPNSITNEKTSYFFSLYDEQFHTVMYEKSAKYHTLNEKEKKKLSEFYNKAGGIYSLKEPFFNTSNDYHILQFGEPDNPYFLKFEIMKYSYKNTTNYSFPFKGREIGINNAIDEKTDIYNFHWVVYAGDREIKHFFPTFISYLKKLLNNILLDDTFLP